jgi:hypothetical protein
MSTCAPCAVLAALYPCPDLPVEDLEEYLTLLRQSLTHAGVDTSASAGPSTVVDEREEKPVGRARVHSPAGLDASDDDADSFSSA